MCAHPRHTLTRCGIHFRSTQMDQCNGFRSRLWQSMRTFTVLDPRFKNCNMWSTRKYVTIHTYAQSVCSVAKLNDRIWTRLTCFFFGNKKYNLQWDFQQLREVWTKDFKSSPSEEDDVEEDDVKMTGEGSGDVSRVDEDPFEKEMCLVNETSAEQHRVSTTPRYVKPKRSINWRSGCTLMSTRRTLTSLGCGDSSMVALHLEAG
jgi:hypothetical protein